MSRFKKIYLGATGWPGFFLFGCVHHFFGAGPALFTALTYTVIYLLCAQQNSRTSPLDYAILGYWLTGLALFLFASPLAPSYLVTRQTFFIYCFLFLAASLSLLPRMEPFTMVFARRRVPQEFWQSRQFLTINRQMTIVWSLLFATAILLTLGPGILFKIILPILMMLCIGIPFTRRYPAYFLRNAGLAGFFDTPGGLVIDTEKPIPASSQAPTRNHITSETVPGDTDHIRNETARELGPVKNVLVFRARHCKKLS